MSLRARVPNKEFSMLTLEKQVLFLGCNRAPNARPSWALRSQMAMLTPRFPTTNFRVCCR